MNHVLVFRSDLLPLSETFIRQQIVGLTQWKAVLMGYRYVSDGLRLDGLETRIIPLDQQQGLSRWRWESFCLTGWPMPLEIRAALALHPALVHVHFGLDAVHAWRWLRHLDLPVTVTLHGYDVNIHPSWWAGGAGGQWHREYPARLRALAREPRVSFIAVSQAIRRRAIDAYGIPPQKVQTIHIGVDEDAFTPSAPPVGEREPTVLFVGRLVEKKGPTLLLRAMRAVQDAMPNAELVMVGDGPLRAECEDLSRDLGLRVRLLGAQPSSVVRQLLAEVRVFCLPSVVARNGDAEGMGLVLLEAQASGVPVVTSALGGRDEGIVDGETGFAFEEGDVPALAQHLLRLLGDGALANRMGSAAARFVAERMSLKQCTQTLEQHYTRLATA